MNPFDLLEIIGQAQDPHILCAVRTRKTPPPSVSARRAPVRWRRKILLAAVIALLLVLTACAARYVADLFVTYFREVGSQEISSSQIDYIQRHAQPAVAQPVVTEADNGCCLSVRSALTDGRIAYITVDIAAPEDVSLEDGQVRFYENPLLIPEQTDGLVIAPDGSSPDAMCDYETIDDGDGKKNTASIMFRVLPAVKDPAVSPFDGSIHWRLLAGGFEKSTFSSETMAFTHMPLGEGSWEFDLQFQQMDTRSVEFVAVPVPMRASLLLHDEYDIDCTLTSFTLTGLGHSVKFTTDYVPGDQEILDIGDITIVMKDGTSQTLLRVTQSVHRTAPNAPMILDNVDHVRFRDGTILHPVP